MGFPVAVLGARFLPPLFNSGLILRGEDGNFLVATFWGKHRRVVKELRTPASRSSRLTPTSRSGQNSHVAIPGQRTDSPTPPLSPGASRSRDLFARTSGERLQSVLV